MTMLKKKPAQQTNQGFFGSLLRGVKSVKGFCVLMASLFALSLLAGASFESTPKVYMAGDIAEGDVISDRDLRVEDPQATRAKIKQVQAAQQPVYDFSMEPFTLFQRRINDIFQALDAETINMRNPVLAKLAKELGQPTAEEILPILAKPQIQSYILKKIMPNIRNQLADGMVPDGRAARVGRSGMLIRNLDNKTETLRPEVQSIADAQTFLAELASQLRHALELTAQERAAINAFIGALMPVSLTLNQEASKKRAADAMANVQPVYYQIEKGELLLRKGERVSRELQMKLQAIYDYSADAFRWNIVAGSFIVMLILSIGFFMSPSGKPGTPMAAKDLYLVSIILLFFGLAAKGAYNFGLHLDSIGMLNAFATAFPVEGAVGLVAMVFAARRYCTMGLLLSFICMLMFQASYELFLFYFLSSMLTTWLVTHSQTRQDVVWSVIPLSIGLICMGGGLFLLDNMPLFEWIYQLCAVIISSLLTLIILFAISPFLEMAFSYSTRFRLMELMSLEQPLMREIMMTIPGTYHHSLVVANMVEAGARAIGANSLLCKVAALYHDAGKLSYPDYFIENQFGGPNKHDRLSPSMSALILHSHVKKGTELAEKYNLGQEIADIIGQHHGTRMMKFFYQKALDQGEKVQEADFCYPGPKPQTKEAAILMLADSVEASSRTLADPTPSRIKNHIDSIIKGIFAEGQLDESELTFKDLHYLSENFQRILTGIFHQRIAYPESKIRSAQGGGEKKQAKNPENPAPVNVSQAVS